MMKHFLAGTRTTAGARVLERLPQRVRLRQVAHVTILVGTFVDRAPLATVGEILDSRVVGEHAEAHFVRRGFSVVRRLGSRQRLVDTVHTDLIARSQLERRSQPDIQQKSHRHLSPTSVADRHFCRRHISQNRRSRQKADGRG